MTLTPDQFPYTGPYSIDGNGRHKGPTATALKRAMARLGYLPWEPDVWDDHYNQKLEGALDRWDPGKNGYGDGRYDRIRAAKIPSSLAHGGEYALDSVCINLVNDEYEQQPAQSVPNLGPMFSGGKSVLAHDLTHATSGIALYPAFDDAFSQGTTIIAPEPLTCTRASSSNPGDAAYFDSASGLRYWIGHLSQAPSPGAKLNKGQKVGSVCANSQGGGPHVHVAINVEQYLGFGPGQQLLHHTNYTHGAPTVGDQLEAVLL